MASTTPKDSGVQDSPNLESYNSNHTVVSETSVLKDNEKLPVSDKDDESHFDHGYSWFVCLACFLLNFSTWGMNSGFAIYFSYYSSHDTFKGATSIDYSYIGGMAFGVGLSLSPIINYIYGVIGVKNTIIVGNCLQFTSLMLASWAKSLWQLYCTQGLMQSFGLAFISMPSLTILPMFFKKKRMLASSLATSGAGVGGIIFNLGMQKVVETKSVFWALRVQSIIAFGLTWIAIILIRTPPTAKVVHFTAIDIPVLKMTVFWIMIVYVVTCIFAYVIVLYTLADFTTTLGYSEYQGSISAAMVQVGSCVGRPVVGLLADRFGSMTVVIIAYLISGIFCLAMWIPARNFATVIAFAIIEGGLMGSVYFSFSPISARTFGIAKMNVSFSMIWVFLGIAGIFSPVIGSKLTRPPAVAGVPDPEEYKWCSLFAGLSFIVAALSLLVVRGYVTARDSLLEEGDTPKLDYTEVRVPPGSVLKSCLLWNKTKV